MLAPRGPAFVSIPMDDWNQEAEPDRSDPALLRRVTGRSAPNPEARPLWLPGWRRRSARRWWPAPTSTPRAAGRAAIALAEKQHLAVWATAATGSAAGLPRAPSELRRHPASGDRAEISETLQGYHLVLVAGSPYFPDYPYIGGPFLGPDTELVAITSDPSEAARAPMGDAIVGDPGLALHTLLEQVPEAQRPNPEPRPDPGEPPTADPLSGSEAVAALADAWPQDAIAVVETPSCTLSLRNRLRICQPGSYYFCASGGLGFGIAAAVGFSSPDRPVVCVLGEGSAQYGITALWSAAAYKAPVPSSSCATTST